MSDLPLSTLHREFAPTLRPSTAGARGACAFLPRSKSNKQKPSLGLLPDTRDKDFKKGNKNDKDSRISHHQCLRRRI
jgi:hypothetical protein